ncbi:MAG: alpha-amylase [Ignavibacteria bacterium]|nr:alpha-amylase [Bacteroidota bacterium]MSQ46211.1 alpha-amylase [Ignavibacteria bacterium]
MKKIILFFIPLLIFGQQKYSVPDWSKEAVWYQIFPERFRNGDTSNDPTIETLTGSWPHDEQTNWKVSPWTSDWYKLQPWEVDGKGFYYHGQLRRYGGDLQGIIDKLDYLQKLGVTSIYLNPIFESPSLHKYDAKMYHHVENNFGPDPKSDKIIWENEDPSSPSTWKWTSADKLFLKLIQESHKRNMKIIIDGVFNHCGMTFWAFEDVKKNGINSKYVNWFTIKKWDDPSTTKNEFEYEGWYGIKELPELKEVDGTLEKSIREHIHQIVKRWMDPNNDGNPEDGIDGWRLDVAEMVPIKFWKEFRSWTREINPNSFLVGEVWWEDWKNNKMFDPTLWIKDGEVFDAVMNYRLTAPMLNYFNDNNSKITASKFVSEIEKIYSQFPADVLQAQMNTLESHDTDRLSSIVVNPDRWFDHNASVSQKKDYEVRKPNADEIKKQKLIILFQMICVGSPTVYYGAETGMWGGDDPDERKPMLWKDFVYENEISHPFNIKRQKDSVFVNEEFLQFYTKIISIRNKNDAIKTGSFKFIKWDDQKDILVVERKLNSEVLLIAFNNSNSEQIVSITTSSYKNSSSWIGLYDNEKIEIKNGNINLTLAGKGWIILKSL